MTYADAIAAGYTHGDRTFFRGYTSRRIDPADQPVLMAGGNRRGDLYVELPNPNSTMYGTIRQYLRPPVA